MAKFRKIDPRIWNDAKFRSLSHLGKLTFFFLITHPNMTAFGAMRASEAGLASEMKALPEAFREAFSEVCSRGMAKYDPEACLLVLPNFLKYQTPESPNVIRAWSGAEDMLPECDLKFFLFQHLRDFVKGMSEGFKKAFQEAFPIDYAEQGERRKEKGIDPPIVPPSGDDGLSSEQKAEIAGTYLLPPHIDTSPPPPGLSEATLTAALTELEHATPKRPRKPTGDPDIMQRVFAHWQVVMKHKSAQLDPKRKRSITAALAMGYTEQQLLDAIDGCALTPWNMGLTPDNQTRYDSLKLILRDADQIDRFVANKANPPPIDRAVAANNPVAKTIVNRKQCEACKVGFTPGDGYKPVGVWVVCGECRPNAEARLKRIGDEEYAKRMEGFGMIKNSDGQWVKPQEVSP